MAVVQPKWKDTIAFLIMTVGPAIKPTGFYAKPEEDAVVLGRVTVQKHHALPNGQPRPTIGLRNEETRSVQAADAAKP